MSRCNVECHARLDRVVEVERRIAVVVQGADEGEDTLSIDDYLKNATADPVPGVYAIYDTKRSLQYVGIGQDVITQLKVRKSWTSFSNTRTFGRSCPEARSNLGHAQRCDTNLQQGCYS